MVHLISGKKNSGKTTKLSDVFNRTENARGFAAKKIRTGDEVVEFILTDLRDGRECLLGRRGGLPVPDGWEIDFTHGPFNFMKRGFQWARDHFEQSLEAGAAAYFIDELGKIELQGKGHAALLHRAAKTEIDLYITVRDVNVARAVEVFGFDVLKTIPVV